MSAEYASEATLQLGPVAVDTAHSAIGRVVK
jgi:hypothetical protein